MEVSDAGSTQFFQWRPWFGLNMTPVPDGGTCSPGFDPVGRGFDGTTGADGRVVAGGMGVDGCPGRMVPDEVFGREGTMAGPMTGLWIGPQPPIG